MVEKGQAEAFPMDDVLLFGFRANAQNPDRFTSTGDALSTEPYAIMLRKDNAPFKAIVDREMGRIVNDREIYKLAVSIPKCNELMMMFEEVQRL